MMQSPANRPLPANIRQDIVERADGIPLFVEEMTKAVLEAQGEGASDARCSNSVADAGGSGEPACFAHGAARPARTGEGRGADRRCDRPGVFSRSSGCGGARDRGGVELVVRPPYSSGPALPGGVPPHATYLFKHALVQDTAYGTLLARAPTRAARPHRGGARKRIRRGGGASAGPARPPLSRGRASTEKAAGLWGKAGERSLERFALIEATDSLPAAST